MKTFVRIKQLAYWLLTVGLVVQSIGNFILWPKFSAVAPPAHAANNDAMVVYDTQTAAGRALYYRTWNGTTWSAEVNAETPSGGQLRYVVIEYDPTANEAIAVTQTSTGYVDAQVWNGTSWNSWVQLGNVGSTPAAYRGFDIMYETSSGDAIVVYGDTTGDPNYRTWNGTTWGSETNIDLSTTGATNWIDLARNPTSSDEICMIVLDANGDVFGSRWTGSAWDSDWDDTGANPDAVWDAASSQATGVRMAIAVDYETTTGEALFMWGNDTQDQVLYKTYSSGTLSGDNTLTIAALDAAVDWLVAKRNTNATNDDILLGVQGATPDLSTRRWSGTAWDSATEHPEHDTALEDATGRNFDLIWETHASNLNTAWLQYSNDATITRKQMTSRTGGSTNWAAGTTYGDDTQYTTNDASPGNGAIVSMSIYDASSSTDDIEGMNRSSDGSTWAAFADVWTGATVDPGYQEIDVACRLTGGNDCLTMYGKEAVAAAWGTSTLSWRAWTGSWGAANPFAMATVRGDARFLRLAFSSYRDNEAILVSQSLRGEVDAQVWNGSSWGNYQRMNVVNTDLNIEAGFAVAYEDTTGDALVVYTRNGQADPGYRVWNGSSWGSESTIDIQTSAEPSWIKLATDRGSDDVALITIDTAEDVYGMYWNGSSWDDMNSGGTEPVWDAVAADDQYDPIDVAFENNSGHALFVWGDSTATHNCFRTYAAGTLSSVDTTNLDIAAAAGVAMFVKLAADPSSGSDMILYGQNDSTSNLNTRKWSGSAWDTATEHAEHSGTTEVATDRCFDIVWETYSGDAGKAWLMWGDGATADATTIFHKEATVTAGTLAWAVANTLTADDTTGIQLIAQPDSGALLAMHYQATSSLNDDLMETHITDGGTTWSAIVQIWAGPAVAVPGFMRVALASELYDPAPPYTPESTEWRWYDAENTADPANSNGSDTSAGDALANESTTPTSTRIVYSGNIVKLRVGVDETTGGAGTDVKFKLQYDNNPLFPTAADVGESGSGAVWRYANGVDADNELILTRRISTTAASGTHNESGTSSCTIVPDCQPAASTSTEFEFTIQNNGANVSMRYFFRLYYTENSGGAGTPNGVVPPAVPNDYPSLTAAAAYDLELSTAPASVSYGSIDAGTNDKNYVFTAGEKIGFWDKRGEPFTTYTLSVSGTNMTNGGNTILNSEITWTSKGPDDIGDVLNVAFTSSKTGMDGQNGATLASTRSAYIANPGTEGKGGFYFSPTIDITNLAAKTSGNYTGTITLTIV